VAPRAYWKGYLKLSLVSCPIALFPATSEREKISFHQLHKEGNRIRYRKVDAETGEEVDSSHIIKGYEVAKGEYIELEPEELEAVAIDSKRVIEIDEFVPKAEIDELYLRDPYFIVPDGEVGQQAFAGAAVKAVVRNSFMKPSYKRCRTAPLSRNNSTGAFVPAFPGHVTELAEGAGSAGGKLPERTAALLPLHGSRASRGQVSLLL
jgi:hypothetical protein